MDQQMKTASPEKGTMEQQRAKFLENLRKAGLEMEEVKTLGLRFDLSFLDKRNLPFGQFETILIGTQVGTSDLLSMDPLWSRNL